MVVCHTHLYQTPFTQVTDKKHAILIACFLSFIFLLWFYDSYTFGSANTFVEAVPPGQVMV